MVGKKEHIKGKRKGQGVLVDLGFSFWHLALLVFVISALSFYLCLVSVHDTLRVQIYISTVLSLCCLLSVLCMIPGLTWYVRLLSTLPTLLTVYGFQSGHGDRRS